MNLENAKQMKKSKKVASIDDERAWGLIEARIFKGCSHAWSICTTGC